MTLASQHPKRSAASNCRNSKDVQAMIKEEVAAVAKHGEIGNGRVRTTNSAVSEKSDTATYILRRLKRDARTLRGSGCSRIPLQLKIFS